MGQVSRSRRRYEIAAYVILSRFSPGAFAEPQDFRKLADAVSSRIKKDCKGVTWKQSFATFGAFRRSRHRRGW
jgi:uncharacterized protein with GYD domain